MIFHQSYRPCRALQAYISSYSIIAVSAPMSYNVLPGVGMVAGIYPDGLQISGMGFRSKFVTAELFGLQDSYRRFTSDSPTEFLTVHFTETGGSFICNTRLHELFNASAALDSVFPAYKVRELTDRLAAATSTDAKVSLLNSFFLAALRTQFPDPIILDSLNILNRSNGIVPIADLALKLNISQSRLEKRFRGIVGASPKKFASLVRMNRIVSNHNSRTPLTKRAYDAGYFDQAHFIRDLKSFTGLAPKTLFRILESVSGFMAYNTEKLI